MEAKQTSLIDLLERIPQGARLVVEHDQFSSSSHPVGRLCHEAAAALKAALAHQENKTPITDDHGKALLPQYQVIEQSGNWVLLYDQMQDGEKVRHEFRIQKLRHDVALYPGITLAEAQKRFRERVEADNE